MDPQRVRLECVSKQFGRNAVLGRLAIDVEPGEFLVVLGPSGCGKTTLLNIVAGLETVDEGRVFIGDRDVTDLPPKQRNVAMVFQSLALYPTMTAGQNIAFSLKVSGVSAAEMNAKVSEIARLLKIEALLDRLPGKLSGGERQRVAIGRALVRDPAVMLLDEPLSNLDSILRAELRAELKRLHRAAGRTTLYVTHDQVEAMTLATRIAVLDGGRIQQCDTPRVVYSRPANATVAKLLGYPAMRFLDGVAVPTAGKNGCCICGIEVADLSGDCAGRKVSLGIRPEHVEVVPDGTSNALKGVVVSSEATGVDAYLTVAVEAGELTVRVPPETELEPGREVWVRLVPAAISVFCAKSGDRLN